MPTTIIEIDIGCDMLVGQSAVKEINYFKLTITQPFSATFCSIHNREKEPSYALQNGIYKYLLLT